MTDKAFELYNSIWDASTLEEWEAAKVAYTHHVIAEREAEKQANRRAWQLILNK